MRWPLASDRAVEAGNLKEIRGLEGAMMRSMPTGALVESSVIAPAMTTVRAYPDMFTCEVTRLWFVCLRNRNHRGEDDA